MLIEMQQDATFVEGALTCLILLRFSRLQRLGWLDPLNGIGFELASAADSFDLIHIHIGQWDAVDS